MASSPTSTPKRVSVSREATPPSPHVTTHPDLVAMLQSSDEEEDDAILRPKGRLAARMLQNARVQDSDSESGTEKDATSQRQSPAKDTTSTYIHEEAEEDDNLPTRPRKLLSRRQRSATPDRPPQEHAGSSPGLFVSPAKPQSPTAQSNVGDDSCSEDGLPSVAGIAKKSRLLAFEARKRKAREEKEAEEAREREERLATQQSFEDDMDVDADSDVSDDDGGLKLTQKTARPAPRKTNKKALEEMNRETQRLTRSLQLAHEVKVKKKITKSALFERFNFKLPGSETPKAAQAEVAQSSSRAASPASHRQTDTEDKDTPPSSPPAPVRDIDTVKDVPTGTSNVPPPLGDDLLSEDENGGLPTLEAALDAAAAKRSLEKGKGKGKEIAAAREAPQQQPAPKVKKNVRVKLPVTQVNTVTFSLDDDDDDLAILPKTKVDAIFDRLPANLAKESRPMQMLRRLAHLDDPEKKPAVPNFRKEKQTDQPPPMTAGELEMTLLQRARLQAKLERDRHLEMLRSKGIHVQTAEEREKEIAQVEDIVSRARKEAEELMQREREDAKADRKARRDAGEADPLGWDDSDESDDDYQAEPEQGEEQEEAEVELSGSEEDDVDMDEQEEEEEDAEKHDLAGGPVDDVAESAEESEDQEPEEIGDEGSDEEEPLTSKQPRRRPVKQKAILLSDSEDEEEMTPQKAAEATPKPKAKYPKSPSGLNTESPKIPTSVLRSATKNFIPGLPVAGPAGLGLTQIFAGTMDDSQVGGSAMGSPSQPMPTFQPASAITKMLNNGKSANSQTDAFQDPEASDFPDSNFSQTAQEVGEDMILDSQPAGNETQDPETQGVQLRFSQSQMHGFDTYLEQGQSATQASDLIEPTQDAGFRNFSPLKKRFVEPPASTVETVKPDEATQEVDTAVSESPLVRRTGKLRRKADLIAAAARSRSPSGTPDRDDEDRDGMEGVETDEFGFGTTVTATATTATVTTAFTVMKEAAIKEKKAKAQAAFDKKKSKAREMVDAEAEESEDEYAGLGGADGEDSEDEDQLLEEIIDDETKNTEADERKLAAIFADQERAADEKQVDKLFRDITTGMLRKRGADWDDLSDDDDGGEALRRMKRQKFAKMQRALFADERISKVAENPRNQAFLRAIEDVGSDDDMDFLFEPPPPPLGSGEDDSQDTQGSVAKEVTIIPDSQPQAGPERLPANSRRTKDGKKPSNIGEIRESLSNLLEDQLREPSVIPATVLGSDDEDEETMDDGDEVQVVDEPSTRRDSSSSDKENRNPRRRGMPINRAASKDSKVSDGAGRNRFAFAAAPTLTRSSSSLVKGPGLLRRATTNSSLISTGGVSSSSSGTTTPKAKDTGTSGSLFGQDAKIKKTTTTSKRSGISYLARENERRTLLAENQARREARKVKGAVGRSKVVGELFGAGKFA
ncbi:mediator of replication checkpoint protein 1 [Rhypophila sp. PSN 637]